MSERMLLVSLVDYDLWATRRVIAAAGRLPAAALDAPSANRDWTVRSGFAHVLDATAHWLGQVEWRRAPPIEAAMLPDVESISDVADRWAPPWAATSPTSRSEACRARSCTGRASRRARFTKR